MKIYVSGGAKNGKSTLAQNLAVLCSKYEDMAISSIGVPDDVGPRAQELPLYYVATMIPTDEEDRIRIMRHREDRSGLGFKTVERPKDLSRIVTPDGGHNCGYGDSNCDPHGVYLIDSVTALLSNVMFPPHEDFNPHAAEEVKKDLAAFLSKVDHAIFVSDYIYADAGKKTDAEDYTDTYMRGLAYIDRSIAKLCDELIEVSSGIAIHHGEGTA
ncbi:MAG: bifunctional adenosylcobinamide kinase/adenosylcobinamide-phosphate guanylyltransferase [Firmicutes bacterium]|nr:bifunctional adenosylcobinamide kinase/adenosylcobinamide-phosphate guanylyltransferase [Bacillota bacterium]